MESQRPQSAGWYEDPNDPEQLRYFDGIVWSDHVTPRRTRTAEPSSAGDGAQAAPPTGWATNPYAGPPPTAPSAGMPGPYGPAPTYGGQVPWGAVQGFGPQNWPLAEWWRRLLGSWVDSLITSVLVVVVGWPWVSKVIDLYLRFVRDSVAAAEAGSTVPATEAFQTQLLPLVTPVLIVSVVVGLIYQTGFLVWRGATPGKMLLGTQVVRLDGEQGVPVATALRRQLIPIAASVVGLVPLLGVVGNVVSVLDNAWLLWDPKKQCLHDKVAKTVVVKSR